MTIQGLPIIFFLLSCCYGFYSYTLYLSGGQMNQAMLYCGTGLAMYFVMLCKVL